MPTKRPVSRRKARPERVCQPGEPARLSDCSNAPFGVVDPSGSTATRRSSPDIDIARTIPAIQPATSLTAAIPSGNTSLTRIKTPKYWMDNANSEMYEGYDFATDLAVGCQTRRFEVALLVQNLFDQRYAVEAQKDLYGGLQYSPAAPRSILARFAVNF